MLEICILCVHESFDEFKLISFFTVLVFYVVVVHS